MKEKETKECYYCLDKSQKCPIHSFQLIENCEHKWSKPKSKVWLCLKCRKIQNFDPSLQFIKDFRTEFENKFVANNILDCIPEKNWEEMKEEVFCFIFTFLDSKVKEIIKYRNNQISNRIENIITSKYKNEPQISKKLEKAIMNCFNNKNYEPKLTLKKNE